MTSDRDGAGAEWTLGDAILLGFQDPESEGSSLKDFIKRAKVFPRRARKEGLVRAIRRGLGSGLLEEREGRFFPTETLGALRLAVFADIDAEVDSACASDEDCEAGCSCCAGPDFDDLVLNRLRSVRVLESDWEVGDEDYRRARRARRWSAFWLTTLVTIPFGIVTAAIMIPVYLIGAVWLALRWVAGRVGRLLGLSA